MTMATPYVRPCDRDGHTFRLRWARGHEEVHCTLCYFVPQLRYLVAAYVSQHGGSVLP